MPGERTVRKPEVDPLLWHAKLEIRRQGRTQESVADEMGVFGKQLSQLLNGKQSPNLVLVRKLYAVLGMEIIAARPVRTEHHD